VVDGKYVERREGCSAFAASRSDSTEWRRGVRPAPFSVVVSVVAGLVTSAVEGVSPSARR